MNYENQEHKNIKKTPNQEDYKELHRKKLFSLQKERKARLVDQKRQCQVCDNVGIKPFLEDLLLQLPYHTAVLKNSASSPSDVSKSIQYLRNILSYRYPPIAAVIQCNVVNELIAHLHGDNRQLQMECAWIFTNMAIGDKQQIRYLFENNVILNMVDIVKGSRTGTRGNGCGYNDFVDQCAWCLGNVACDNEEYRNFLISIGCLDAVMNLISDAPNHKTTVSVCRTPKSKDLLAWVLCSFFNKMPILRTETLMRLIKLTERHLQCMQPGIVSKFMKILSVLTESSANTSALIAKTGILEVVMQFAQNDKDPLFKSALVVIGNLSSGEQSDVERLLDHGILVWLRQLLQSDDPEVVTNALWIVSNLAASCHETIEKLIAADLLSRVVRFFKMQGCTKIKREVLHVCTNALIAGSNMQKQYVLGLGVAEHYCTLLRTSDLKIIVLCLEGIYEMLKFTKSFYQVSMDYLEKTNAQERIEELQHHDYYKICDLAKLIVDEFFNTQSPMDIIHTHNDHNQ